jgi:nucleoside-diphosphate-sugar epimerase
MKVLFIGGTGIISSACSQLAVDRGIDLYLLNRGNTTYRKIPSTANLLQGDIRDRTSVEIALGEHSFDVVVNWIAYTRDHIDFDIEIFRDRTKQYIFISSASAYQTPPSHLPVTEATIVDNPYWQYSRDKIDCENRLIKAYRDEKFPFTIVRPSHTYDDTLLPFTGGFTMVDRMRKGKKVIVHGDGTSLWTLTHHKDFAVGLVGLLGNSHALGETFHITSDENLTWNQIYEIIAQAAGAVPKLVHVPSDLIAAYDPDWGAGLLGDKAHSMIFDNSKIKRVVPDFNASVPFSQGAREIISWYDNNPSHQTVDERLNFLIDKIISEYETCWPKT